MKVVLDLTKLLEEKKITQAEYDKFSHLGAQATSSLAFNLLVGFGVVAVSCASIALVPSGVTALVLGAIIGAIGGGLRTSKKWELLSQMCILIGSLLLAGGILWLDEGSLRSWLVVTILFAIGAILARSGLLIALSLLALSSTIGAAASYQHATYDVAIEQPTFTIIIFSLISFLTYWLSQHLHEEYERLAIIASRTGILLVNFGFWVGSLWGDELPHKVAIPDWSFAAVWAIALIAIGVWAVKANRPWVVNISAVFLGINFYTQWFERLGASPLTVLGAGILALVFAIALKSLNSMFKNT